jgi:hypothetical protein
MNPKLYAVYLGGKAPGANTEIHDTVFLITADLSSDKDKIKALWFGNKNSVHIDSHAIVYGVGEYKVVIGDESDPNLDHEKELKLFFINFGASDPGKLSEKHQSGFFVGKDKTDAIRQAKQVFLVNDSDVHLDNSLEVDDCIDLNDKFNFRILLVKAQNDGVQIVNKYQKL